MQGSAHARCDSAQNKFVGPTVNSKSRSVAIFFNSSLLSFIRPFDRASVIAGLVKYVRVCFSDVLLRKV